MNTTPQNVTSRYVRNLVMAGCNSTYRVGTISREISETDGIVVGEYYSCLVKRISDSTAVVAVGVTIEQAVTRALEKLGVTFRS